MDGWHDRWIDLTMLIVLLLSVAFGVLRGLVYELLSLLGWVAAWVVARLCAAFVAGWLPIGEAGSTTRYWVAFVLCFVLTLIAWGIGARLLRLMVQRIPLLGGLDRLLGGAFGLLRGVALLLAVTAIVHLTPMVGSTAWQQSTGAVWLTALLQDLKAALPAGIYRHVDPCETGDDGADCASVSV